MQLKNLLLLVAAALLFAAASSVQAQDHAASRAKTSSVRLGDRVVVIPDPEGFEEATLQFERYRERLVATEAPTLDTLLGHLPTSDCDLLRKGSAPTYNHYTKVSVLRAGRELDVSREVMAQAVEGYRANVGAVLDPNGPEMKALVKKVEQGLSAVDSKQTTVDFSRPQQLGEFDARPDINSFLMLMTIKVNQAGAEATVPMLASVSFVRVNERLIYVYGFRKYKSAADMETLKQFATKWTSSIVAANRPRN